MSYLFRARTRKRDVRSALLGLLPVVLALVQHHRARGSVGMKGSLVVFRLEGLFHRGHERRIPEPVFRQASDLFEADVFQRLALLKLR